MTVRIKLLIKFTRCLRRHGGFENKIGNYVRNSFVLQNQLMDGRQYGMIYKRAKVIIKDAL